MANEHNVAVARALMERVFSRGELELLADGKVVDRRALTDAASQQQQLTLPAAPSLAETASSIQSRG